MELKVTITVKFLGVFLLLLYAAQYMYNWKNQTKTFDKKKNWTKTWTQKDLVPEKGPTSIHFYILLYKK